MQEDYYVFQEDLEQLKSFVDKQAEDDGLWFVKPQTISEAYLQEQLRELHGRIDALCQVWLQEE